MISNNYVPYDRTPSLLRFHADAYAYGRMRRIYGRDPGERTADVLPSRRTSLCAKKEKGKKEKKKKKENSFALRLAISTMSSTASSSYFVLFDTLLHRSLYTYIHLGRRRSQTAESRESRVIDERKENKTSSPLVSSPTDVPRSLPFESLRLSTAIEFAVK